LDKIKADRAAEAVRQQKAKEEAERLKREAMASDEEEAEEGQKSEKEEAEGAEGAEPGEEAKPASAEAPREGARPFTPEEQDEIKLAAGDSDDEFEPIAIKEKVKEFRKGTEGADRIPPHLINEAVRWRLNRNDCQNRGYVLDGYPKNAQSA